MEDKNTSASLGAGLVGALTLPPENNVYKLYDFNTGDQEVSGMQKVVFYKMNPDGSREEGTTLEEMLRVSIERLNDLNRRFSCRENSLAITKMEEALMWLKKRTEDRKGRGVEGKHLA